MRALSYTNGTALALQSPEREGKTWKHQSQEKLNLSSGERVAPQNGFLFIGELAKLTGTDPKTIRFYERAELISPPRHGRFRTYLASDVRRLKNVLTLRRLGVPIAQIREILDMLSPEEDVLASEKAVSLLRTASRHAEEPPGRNHPADREDQFGPAQPCRLNGRRRKRRVPYLVKDTALPASTFRKLPVDLAERSEAKK